MSDVRRRNRPIAAGSCLGEKDAPPDAEVADRLHIRPAEKAGGLCVCRTRYDLGEGALRRQRETTEGHKTYRTGHAGDEGAMKILESQSAVLSNYEVYTFLKKQRERYKKLGKSKDYQRPGNLETLVKEVRDPVTFKGHGHGAEPY